MESDSREAINMTIFGCSENHPLRNLIVKLREMSNRRWDIVLRLCYIKGNMVAYWTTAVVLVQ